MDLDGTLTQHKTPLSSEHREVLTKLSAKYKLLMVGAGQAMRIFNQMNAFPIDVIGNYGMQYGVFNAATKTLDIARDVTADCDKEKSPRKSTFCAKNTAIRIFAERVWSFILPAV